MVNLREYSGSLDLELLEGHVSGDILTTSETNFSSSVSVPWCSFFPLKRDDALFYFLRSIDDYFCHPCLLILCLGWIIFISYHLHMIHTTHLKNTQECLCGPYFVTLNSKPSFRPHFLPPSLPQYSRSTYLLTIKKKMHTFIYFWLCWVLAASRGLSLVVASGGYSSLWCSDYSL